MGREYKSETLQDVITRGVRMISHNFDLPGEKDWALGILVRNICRDTTGLAPEELAEDKWRGIRCNYGTWESYWKKTIARIDAMDDDNRLPDRRPVVVWKKVERLEF